jgi:D-alanyl-lipoteichoic acid acyltransferase DltB (MBOAT superfamily)
MALGSSLMFGIRLPFNFNSPYKAASIIDFWRRWHVSLSQFLRDYLYFPLGGNRHGRGRRYLNLFITMLLGGLWHGANWTFMIWGGLHGAYLAINHAWRHVIGKRPPSAIFHALSVLITFLATMFAWVLFRAQTFADARRVIAGLIGQGGDSAFLSLDATAIVALIALFGIVWLAPNSMEITWKLRPALEPPHGYAGVKAIKRMLWRPTAASAVMFAVLAVICVLSLSNLSPFIYFQF